MGDSRKDRTDPDQDRRLQSVVGAVFRGRSASKDPESRSTRRNSRSRSNPGDEKSKVDDLVRSSLERVRRNILGQTSSEVEASIAALKKEQREFALAQEVSKLKSPDAQGQYRVIGRMILNIESAIGKLDRMSSAISDASHPFNSLLSDIRADLSSAQELGSERCDLIARADENPIHGWNALVMYDRLSVVDSDSERAKLFAACIEKVAALETDQFGGIPGSLA